MKNQKAYEKAFNEWLDRQAILKAERKKHREEMRKKREEEQSVSWNSFLELNFEGLTSNPEAETEKEKKKDDILDSILGYNPWSQEDEQSVAPETKKEEEDDFDLEKQFASNMAHQNYFGRRHGKKKRKKGAEETPDGEQPEDEERSAASAPSFFPAMLDQQ